MHIPFCVQKCKYCDFLSAPADDATKKRYVDALCKEITGYRDLTKEYELATIYFGGGTPTSIGAELLCELIFHLKTIFRLSENLVCYLKLLIKLYRHEKFSASFFS